MGISRYRDRPKTTTQIARMMTANFLLKSSKLCCNGVLRCWVWFISEAILPISVCMPVSVTTTVARPYVTREPEKTIFFWSPKATFSPGMTSSVFSTPSDSPVKELSFTLREKFSITRPSATTRSPASRNTMSPGTTSLEGTSTFAPPRKTFAVGEDTALRLSRDFSALKYCTVPRIALRIRTAKMTMVLSPCPDSMEMMAATIRTTTNRSLNCSRNT